MERLDARLHGDAHPRMLACERRPRHWPRERQLRHSAGGALLLLLHRDRLLPHPQHDDRRHPRLVRRAIRARLFARRDEAHRGLRGGVGQVRSLRHRPDAVQAFAHAPEGAPAAAWGGEQLEHAHFAAHEREQHREPRERERDEPHGQERARLAFGSVAGRQRLHRASAGVRDGVGFCGPHSPAAAEIQARSERRGGDGLHRAPRPADQGAPWRVRALPRGAQLPHRRIVLERAHAAEERADGCKQARAAPRAGQALEAAHQRAGERAA
mmetsp:Transcript_19306/g.41683  ORF Transcript_19306/g.41683 Transcript_19306/m.41683 type:complete len:269 (+) Transcript_19306:809-1615(+)